MDEELKSLLRDLISKMNQNQNNQGAPGPTPGAVSSPVQDYQGRAQAVQQEAATLTQIEQMNIRRQNMENAIARNLEGQKAAAKNIESTVARIVKERRLEEEAARASYNEQQKIVTALQQDLDLSRQSGQFSQQDLQYKQQQLSQSKEVLRDLQQKLQLTQALAQEAQREAALVAQVRDRTQSLVSTLTQGVLTANAASKTGMFGALFGSGSGAGFFEKLKTGGRAIGQIISPLNASLSVVGYLTDAFKKLFFATDQSAAQFRRATGAGQEYTKVLTQTIERNTKFAVMHDEAATAMTTLYNRVRLFSGMSDTAQKSVLDLTVRMNRMGVTSQQTAQMTDMLTKAMGMNINQAIGAIDKLAVYARQIKISEGEATQAFMQFSGVLAAHGPNMMNVFKGLLATVKQTGIEMTTLMQIAGRFDTFDQAAASVGTLNALLGGNYLNSLRMVNATEQERLQLVARAIQASGANINAMERFQQKAVAQAIGAKDAGEAMRLLRGELNMLTPAELEAARAAELNKQKAQENMDIQMKLKTIFLSLANSLMPLIEKLHENRDAIVGVIDKVAKFIGENGKLIAKFAILFPVIRTGITLFGGLTNTLNIVAGASRTARFGLLGLAGGITFLASQLLKPLFSPPLYLAMKDFGDTIKRTGSAASSAAPQMRNMGQSVGELAKNTSVASQVGAQLGGAMGLIGKNSSGAASGIRSIATAGIAASRGMREASNSTAQLAFGVQAIQRNVDKLNTAKLADFGQKMNRVTENLSLTEAENQNVERTIVNINRVAVVGQRATEAASAAGVERLAAAAHKFSLTQVNQTTQVAAAASSGGRGSVHIVEAPREVVIDLDGIAVGSAALNFINRERDSSALVGRA
tara:strand:+ start:4439 stop:7042 length:2604 start_codon:yes stop_codon:yes gene_type:complete